MKVKVVSREWNKTLEDVRDEYNEAVESFDGKFSLAILGHTEVHFVLFFVVMSS